MRERLQKILASAGIASRRAAEEVIAAGAVTVNGRVAQLGDQADVESDIILVRGKPIVPSPLVYLAFNKPAGVVTSLRSTHGEPIVGDLLRGDTRLFPVGRLDRDTSGLLLLTNDGEWSNLVTHPRHAVEKEYLATVTGRPADRVLELLRRGVRLPGSGITAPARVDEISRSPNSSVLRITVIEGKKRQIRLMLAGVGHPVRDLMRVRVGPIRLGDLRPGTWRPLTADEVDAVRKAAGDAIA